MKLRTYCKNCKHAETINGNGIQFRRDLELKHGETVKFVCSNCKKTNENRINQVFAVESKLPLLLSSIVGLAIIMCGILIKSNSKESIIWTTLIGAMFLTAGFYSNMRTSARAFNKTFV